MPLDKLLQTGLVPLHEAAETLGIEPKRLRGFIFRNGIADPIGDYFLDQVYGWSAARLVHIKTAEHG